MSQRRVKFSYLSVVCISHGAREWAEAFWISHKTVMLSEGGIVSKLAKTQRLTDICHAAQYSMGHSNLQTILATRGTPRSLAKRASHWSALRAGVLRLTSATRTRQHRERALLGCARDAARVEAPSSVTVTICYPWFAPSRGAVAQCRTSNFAAWPAAHSAVTTAAM